MSPERVLMWLLVVVVVFFGLWFLVNLLDRV